MKRLNAILVLALALSSLSTAFAAGQRIEIDGTVPGYVHYEKPLITFEDGKQRVVTGQAVRYLHYSLSPEAKEWLATHINDRIELSTIQSEAIPSQAALGMNNVPVSNQGVHGSCVTFALAGVLNAIIGHTNYISELCNLSLGSYLAEQNSNYPSGWDGATARTIFAQMEMYGINSLNTQLNFGCAGVRKYPANNIKNTGKPMSIDAFNAHTEMIMKNISYRAVRRLDEALSNKIAMPEFISNIKTALASGHRVAIGFLLDTDSSNGAHGTYHAKNDSWVITDETIRKAKLNTLLAGHEVIITGYDDNAVINGPGCTFHRGVFTLRNSWGKSAGDKGEYYMSYEYLSKLVLDIYEVLPNN